jgi:hypothetical protein
MGLTRSAPHVLNRLDRQFVDLIPGFGNARGAAEAGIHDVARP